MVFHCSATKEGVSFDVNDIRKWHKARGFRDVGYHYVILLDGTIQLGRPLDQSGAHVKDHNADSIGVCYIGGLDKDGNPKDTRTPEQIESMKLIYNFYKATYPDMRFLGHRDLSPDLDGDGEVERHEWLKACPCFDVRAWLKLLAANKSATTLEEMILHHFKPARGTEDGVRLLTLNELAQRAQIPAIYTSDQIASALYGLGFGNTSNSRAAGIINWMVNPRT